MTIKQMVKTQLGHVEGPRLDKATANIISLAHFVGLPVEIVIRRIRDMGAPSRPPANYGEFFNRLYGHG